MPKPRQPGDLILDRYLPDADDETRERAREVLRRYTLLLIRIGRDMRADLGTTDSSEQDWRPRIESSRAQRPP